MRGQEGDRGTRSTRLCVVTDGLGCVHVASCGVVELEGSVTEECEAVRAPWKYVVVDGVVELYGVLYDRDECVLDIVLSLAAVVCECGA